MGDRSARGDAYCKVQFNFFTIIQWEIIIVGTFVGNSRIFDTNVRDKFPTKTDYERSGIVVVFFRYYRGNPEIRMDKIEMIKHGFDGTAGFQPR